MRNSTGDKEELAGKSALFGKVFWIWELEIPVIRI